MKTMKENKTCLNCDHCRFDERIRAHRCIYEGSVRFGRAVDSHYCCNKWDGEIWEGPQAFYMYKSCLNDTILRHSDVICKLMDDRVLAILFDNDEHLYYLQEMCDEYFTHDLTRDECIELSELFREMAEDIE